METMPEAEQMISMAEPLYEQEFLRHKACVLIPTYNNASRLEAVLQAVLQYTHQVLVINDGSTDKTQQILGRYSVQMLSYEPNRGKGFALRIGFKQAIKLGYDYAITMDSDGQHDPKDLIRFLQPLHEKPETIIVGARNMNVANVPQKSSFGNRFSNFWFWVNTGRKLPDTQSGYRLYPLKKIAAKKYYTRKFEFEIEVLVRAAWSGVELICVPVSVYYPPAAERISHFRPVKDFTRISLLNTVLVLIAFLWIKPKVFLSLLMKKQGWKTIWKNLFIHPQETNHLKAASVAFGVFMGIVPVWGFQLAIGIPLAVLFRLNKTLFLIAANISIFPITPFWWMASLLTGKWLLGDRDLNFQAGSALESFKEAGLSFFLGGTVLALTLGLLAYVISWVILVISRKK